MDGKGKAGPAQAGKGKAGPAQAAKGKAGPVQAGKGKAGPAQAGKGKAGPVRAGSAQGRSPSAGEGGLLWLWARVDAGALRGEEAAIPDVLARALGVPALGLRTFSSRYGPIVVGNDGARTLRGSVRAVALASGARDGDTLMLGFSTHGNAVAVEVHRGGADPSVAAPDSARQCPAPPHLPRHRQAPMTERRV